MVTNSNSHSNLSNSSLAGYSSYGENLHSLHAHHPPHTTSYADLMDKAQPNSLGGEALAFEPSRQRYTAKTHFLPADMPLSELLKPDSGSRITASKVIATIGPSCQGVDELYKMLLAGAGGFRVDLTWGPWDYHKRSLKNLEAACKRAKKLCCTVVDTLGRTIMVRRKCQLDERGWPVHAGAIEVKQGQHLVLTTRTDVEASENVLPITYDGFADLVEKGDTFYIARYLVSGDDQASLYVEVQDVQGTDVICVAKNNATLDGLLTVFHTERSCNPALHVNRQSDLEVLSTYDQECLQDMAMSGLDMDYLSLAYTRSSSDVREARRFLDSIGCTNTKILAKIETRQALLSLNGILQEADGIIMSRGSLGLDCPPEKMAMVQKTLIQSCNLTGKPVLITRVLDTMQNSPRPTRAEATDVANAVLDGVDGILLGAETLRGRYPVETVGIISDICRAAEGVFDHHQHFDAQAEAEEQLLEYKRTHADKGPAAKMQLPPKPTKHKDLYHKILAYDMPAMENTMTSSLSTNCLNHTAEEVLETKLESIASGAVRVADKVGASLLLVYTHTGGTSQMIAKYRPSMPIVTLVVPHLCASKGLKWELQGRSFARQCCLVRGLLPMLAAPSTHGDQILEDAVSLVAQSGLVKPCSYIVCVQRIHEDFCVKVITVDKEGTGIQKQHDSKASLTAGYMDADGIALAPEEEFYVAPMEGAASGRSSLDMSYGGLAASFARR
mmetsp:Transcript_18553/g.48364  ORF Transcript_18553/g.48364 Transcript_18553/m.48364 type:complete len:728 (+) Transcript_18553:1051-3234(+)